MRKLIILVIILAVGLVLTARFMGVKNIMNPGSDSSDSSKPTLVVSSRLWSQPTEREFLLNEIIQPFEQENGCKVMLRVFEDDKQLYRVKAQFASGKITTDVVIVYVSRMAEWVNEDLVLDLTPRQQDWSDRNFSPVFQNMATFDKRLWFLPIAADDYLLCANRKALSYLPKDTQLDTLTWTQLVSWCHAITKAKGEGKLAVTGVPQKMLIYQVGAAVLSYGGGFPDLASPGAIAAWRELVKLKPDLSPAVRTYDSVVPPMKRDEAWVSITHNARVGEMVASNPAKLIIAPPPKGPKGRGSVVGVSGLGVLKNAPHQELALKFIEYMTRANTQLKLARGTGGFIPTVEEAMVLLGASTHDQVVRQSMKLLKTGKLAYIPPTNNWPEIKMLFDDAFLKLVIRDGAVDIDYLKESQLALDELLKTQKTEADQ